LLVNGAAIEASDVESDIPVSAVLRALQSLAPSPHIPISNFRKFWRDSTSLALSSGVILAKIYPFSKTLCRIAFIEGDFTRKLKALPVIAIE